MTTGWINYSCMPDAFLGCERLRIVDLRVWTIVAYANEPGVWMRILLAFLRDGIISAHYCVYCQDDRMNQVRDIQVAVMMRTSLVKLVSVND